MNSICPSLGSFLDPTHTDNGDLYAPLRFEAIVREQYELTRNLNTSYKEIDEITPRERQLLKKFLDQETEAIREEHKKILKGRKDG